MDDLQYQEFMVQKALSSGNGSRGSVNMYGFSHSEKILLAGGKGEEEGGVWRFPYK